MSWSIEQRTVPELPEPFEGITSEKIERYKDITIISYSSSELGNVIKFLEKHYEDLKRLGIKYIVHHYGTQSVPLVHNTVYIYCSPYSDHAKPQINITLPREWEHVSADMDFAGYLDKDCVVIGYRGRPFFAYNPRHNVYVLADITHDYVPDISESLWSFIVGLMKKMKDFEEEDVDKILELMKEDILELRYRSLRKMIAELIHMNIEKYGELVLLPLEYSDGDITIKVEGGVVKLIGKAKAHRKGLETVFSAQYPEKLENLEYDVEVMVEMVFKPVVENGKIMLKRVGKIKGEGYVIIDGNRLWHPNIRWSSHIVCTGDVYIPYEIVIEKNLLTELKYKSNIMQLLASLTNPYLDNNTSEHGYHLWKYINTNITPLSR